MLWSWLFGCPGPTGEPAEPTDATTPQPTDDVLAFTLEPVYERNDAPARLVGAIRLETSRPSTVRIDVDDGGRTWVHTSDEPKTAHEVQVRGLRPDATHTFTVTATDEDAQTVSGSLSFTTDPLPDDFPAFQVQADPSRMEPGVTFAMFNPYIAMVDPEGVVRWYMSTDYGEFVTNFTPRGTFLVYAERRTALIEYDLTGRVIERWRADRATDEPADAVPVDVLAFHHDAVELPNGNLLALSVEERFIEGFPSSESAIGAPPEDAWVAGDVIVELERDGTIVHEWPLFDVLDPLRIGYDVLVSDYWEGLFGLGTEDWSHANAIWYDEERDEVVVSLRHQDAVVGLERTTGALSWILAPDENWRDPWDDYVLRPAAPPASFFYHQHGVKLSPSGTVMLFDNGNNRASAYEPRVADWSNLSRGLEIVIDHDAGTWDTAFVFGEELYPFVYAPAHGDCDALPVTDNVLVTFGSVQDPSLPGVQIYEVTRATPPEVVFQLTLDQPYLTGRADRLTGLLPGF